MTPQPALEMELRPKEETAIAPTIPAVPNVATLIERLALTPDFPVEKLQALIDMQERLMKIQAKGAFDAAFSAMQAELPVIVEHAKTNNGSYAPLEDIVQTVRPILARHGFSLSHRTEWPEKSLVKIIGILAHRDGHEKQSEFLSAADSSGNKNAIQGLGSAVSYGRRYTTKDLLNIVTRGEDDDAKQAARKEEAEPPAGYADWTTELKDHAGHGMAALTEFWKTSKQPFRDYLNKHDRQIWADAKKKAEAVK